MTKINRLSPITFVLALLLSGCVRMPLPTTQEETAALVVYEAEAGAESLVLAAMPGQWVSVSAGGQEVRFRVAADQTFPPSSPALACPCPDLALAHHPNDPDSPGECKARSRTGVAMDAGDHPACGREDGERAGRGW